MNRKKVLSAALVLILLGSASYYLYSRYYQNSGQLLQASGTIEATTVEVCARLNGTIQNLPVNEGSQVQKGQLVAELSRTDLLAQRERDALGVLVAEARYNDLASGFRAEEVEEASSNLSLAEANREQADVDLKRSQQLFDEGALSRDKLEAAQLNRTTREKQVEIAQSRLKLLASGNRPEIVSGAAAELQRSKAVLKTTEAMLADLALVAPLNGTITSKNYETGEYVPLGASLLSISDLSRLWIKVYIPADDLPRVKLNQAVKVTVSGNPQIFSGRVSYIASRGEFTPKTIQTKKERANVVFAVKVTVQNRSHMLKPGMPADVVFTGSPTL
ncbi:HlyD family secretion protein [Syntrophomonas curvata]